MALELGISRDVGRKRLGKPNQDDLGVVLPGRGSKDRLPFYILSDGMGGYTGGEKASKVTIKAARKYYQRNWKKQSAEELLLGAIQAAHAGIKRISSRRKRLAKMGSTVVAAIVDKEKQRAWVANVGDSRAYLIRKDEIRLVSQDHSTVAELQRSGVLTEEEARNHPKKNVLSQSLALKRETVEPFFQQVDFHPGDTLLLCSDGLWGVVSETVIQHSALELPPQTAAEKLINKANDAGGPDNISVIIVRRAGEAEAYQQAMED